MTRFLWCLGFGSRDTSYYCTFSVYHTALTMYGRDLCSQARRGYADEELLVMRI